MSSKPMRRARVDGAELEFEVTGTGEPVLLIHGAFIAEAYAPLCAEPALNSRYQLVRYHRRGYAGSSPVRAPFSFGQQAADCRALFEHLGIERAHVVGHSSGGAIALQLALDAPQVVHSLILLEPGLLDVPSGALLAQVFEPMLEQYGAGNKEGAADNFLRWAIGAEYRAWLDRLIPGAFQQVVADADTFFRVELPSVQEWRFTREDAQRITQPVLGVLGAESASIWPGWNEVQERLREWLPQTEPVVLAGANHALEERDPRGVAGIMAPFLARHPMPVRV
ncbi:Haloacetate dehalogenase H-1 [Luteitalea pratensis]|uniref:Haloacetate dehalogenase H-1 n=1 Tax=Luteitalea pratensis TaxID=1855912 RepID=A0A143PLE9_LUTPR|nr:alpha/beta hydrolase [Luteitalea pratensis]AMY09236.1 Haloacetate dehalogenase H-1 [Luteitalea pratensis]